MYQIRSSQWLRHLDFVIMDCLLMFAGQLLTGFAFGRSFRSMLSGSYAVLLTLVNLVSVITILVLQPHKSIVQRGYWKELTAMFRQYLAFEILLNACVFAVHINIPRRELFLPLLGVFLVNYAVRILMKHMIRLSIRRSDKRNKLVILSTSTQIEDLWDEMTTKNYPKYRITAVILTDVQRSSFAPTRLMEKFRQVNTSSFIERGFAANKENKGLDQDNVTLLYGLAEGNEFIRHHVVDEVFMDINTPVDTWNDQIQQYLGMGLKVHIGLPGMSYDYPNRYISHYGNRLAITTTMNTAADWKLNAKRAMDIVGALVGLAFTAIASIFIIPAIKIADPGPIFFSQIRVGRNGRPFRFYKFRSMYVDAEAQKARLMEQNQMNGLMFKMENDPRIIGSEKGPGKGLGNFLRRTSLDELPQFWNILKGDMSLVGTRPPTYDEYKDYEMRHKARLSMRPGLTGLWQVSGRSNITDFEEVIKLDCEYIENWTLGLDIKIILRTLYIVFHGKGAR